MMFSPFSPIFILLLLALAAALALSAKSGNRWLSRIRSKPLLTANEGEFFHRLERALPAYLVFPQVSFAAFLTDDGQLSKKSRWSLRARFDRKIADFVICDRLTLRMVALVELDDRTHNARADQQRDALTKAAGYRTFRFKSKQKPTEAEIAALFSPPRQDREPTGQAGRHPSRSFR